MQPTITKQVSPQIRNHYMLGQPAVGLGDIGVLTGLGLTVRQARIYLALLKTGDARVKTIADCSSLHRSEVYRLIEELQQLGLVQRNVTVPTTYTATPIAEGTKLLLQNKTSELNLICQKAKQITKKLCQTNGVNPAAFTAKSYLGTVFEGDRGRKYCSAIKEAQHTIEVATTWSRFKQLIALFENPLQKALVKGITIHIVTEKPPDHRLPNWINTTLKKPNFNLKTLQNPIAATTMIFDHTQAAIAFNPNTSLIKGPDIWTNNQSLIALSQAYFDTIWNRQF